MKRSWAFVVVLGTLAAAGCPSGAATRPDAGPTDSGQAQDTGAMDTGTADAGLDAAMMGNDDAHVVADAGADAAQSDAGPPPMVDLLITMIRMTNGAVPGGGIRITNVTVTYVRPAIGSDPGGFFVQFSPTGPALFVTASGAVPPPALGDTVSFTATMTEVVNTQHRVIGISNYVREATGGNVTSFVQDASAVDLSSTNVLDQYESELISLEATITDGFLDCGAPHTCAEATTAGVTTPTSRFTIRTNQSTASIMIGCRVRIGPTPLWRGVDNRAHPSAWQAGEITIVSCPGIDAGTDAGVDGGMPDAGVDAFMPLIVDAGIDAFVPADAGVDAYVPSSPDAGRDSGVDAFVPPPDAGRDAGRDAGPRFPQPGTGDLVITEIALGFSNGPDNRQWVEIYNPRPSSFDLQGCHLEDSSPTGPGPGGSWFAITGSLEIAPGEYVTIGGSLASAALDYRYGANQIPFFDEAADEVWLVCGSSSMAADVVDNLGWTAGTFPARVDGNSWQLSPGTLTAAANDNPSNWCLTPTSVSYGSLIGSPQAGNPACAPVTPDAGMPDAGRDAGVDAATPMPDAFTPMPDAGRDAGMSMGGAVVWINELHYNNLGTDVDEGVEIAGTAGTSLSAYSIVLYNGSVRMQDGAPLALSGTIDDEMNGMGAVWFPRASIQNGDPDGLALIGPGGTVIQFLCYGGTFAALNGPAMGMTCSDMGVRESDSTAVGRSLQLTGTGRVYTDFTWTAPSPHSRGSLNVGQTIN